MSIDFDAALHDAIARENIASSDPPEDEPPPAPVGMEAIEAAVEELRCDVADARDPMTPDERVAFRADVRTHVADVLNAARAALAARDERIAALEAGLREACAIIDDLDFRGDFDTDRGRLHALAGPGCPRCHGPAANPATITTTDGRRVEICGACEAVRLRALADAGKVAP